MISALGTSPNLPITGVPIILAGCPPLHQTGAAKDVITSTQQSEFLGLFETDAASSDFFLIALKMWMWIWCAMTETTSIAVATVSLEEERANNRLNITLMNVVRESARIPIAAVSMDGKKPT
jgi:hypothetical protein